MTEEQTQTLKALYEDYKKHLYDNSSYGSERYCQFIVFENNVNKEDNNITIVTVEIYDLSQEGIPKTKTVHKQIVINGDIENLGYIMSNKDIIDYLQVCTKIKIDEIIMD
jgi:hypothetical protein